ncbi:MAG: DNA internalization-related competence protein ComEC/Rec2 [Chloroflexi bacterium]|nr:MAG: DNA internalization-related competence protein ComEC/Rec2 [Chloroflexota bacterium]
MRLACLSLAWVFGVYLASALPLSRGLLVGGASFLLVGILFPRRRVLLLGLFCLLVFGGGLLRAACLPGPGELALYNGRVVELIGVIDSEPDVRTRFTLFRFKVQELQDELGRRAVSDACLLYAPRFPSDPELSKMRDFPFYRYGDRLWIKGKLVEPPELEEFDYREYLARQGIYSLCYPKDVGLIGEGEGSPILRLTFSLKEKLSRALALAVAEPSSSLAQAMLLGKRSELPKEIREDFQLSGIAHILAISGLHISIVAGMSLSLGAWLFGRHRPYYLLLALLAVWFYALLTGWHPSALRAAIMGSLWAVGSWLGRQRNSFVALLLAAAVMVGIKPSVLKDVSFQLSFAAMAGLIFLSPLFASWAYRALGDEGKIGGGWRFIIESFSFSLGAILATLPLLAFYFHRISLVTLPATFFALPAVPGLIAAAAFSSGLGLISSALAQIPGWICWLFGTYIIRVAEAFSSLPFAAISARVGVAFLAGYYSLLALAFFLVRNWRSIKRGTLGRRPSLKALPRVARGFSSKYVILFLLLVALLLWSAVLALPDGKLHVFFLNVGQGDAILVQTPSRHQILIDGGPDPKVLLSQLGQRLPFWDHSLDLVILTHPEEDHLTGLPEVLRRYRVEKVLESGFPSDSPTYQDWVRLIEQKGIKRLTAQQGQQIRLGEVRVEVLHPAESLLHGTSSDSSNNSVVLRLSHGKISFLLVGDLMREGEEALLRQQPELGSTVLKVGHHGAAGSSSPEFLEAVSPQAAVISVGSNNPFGHPSLEVMARLRERVGQNLFLTSRDGTVEFITDGQKLWVKKER